MTNPLTMQVESGLGALFIALLTAFLIAVLFIAIKNFNSDVIAMGSEAAQVKSMSSTERQLIARWLTENGIELPEGEGYRYVVRQYPNRPWLTY
jgi:hypothetical protein